MEGQPAHARPTFDEALKAWSALLQQKGFPTQCVWVFEENLFFDPNTASAGAPPTAFQVALTPPPSQAAATAYHYFAELDPPLVFYRLGSSKGTSICALLCDEWFEKKGDTAGFMQRKEWNIAFHPGEKLEIEEITDPSRWKQRAVRDRPLHELDFCLSLRAVHELLAHGRIITSYERYALRFLHAWRRLLGQT